MTGRQFKAVRRRLGLGVVQWGALLGYTGNATTISRTVRGYEGRGDDDIPGHIGRLAWLLNARGLAALPPEWLHDAGVLP